MGSTHRTNAKPRAAAGAKASGGTFGASTHEQLEPDRRAKPGAKASNAGRGTLTAAGQDVADPHGTASEQRLRTGRAVEHPHGTEHVSEYHRR